MPVRAAPERPVVLALIFPDRQVVDARDPAAHVAKRIELPVFVAVRAEPVPRIVVPLVREAHRDAVVVKRPQLLDEPVIELLAPLADQELLDLRPPGDGIDDTFTDVGPGTELTFRALLRNEVIPPADYDQIFNLTIRIVGDGVTLSSRRIRVIVPRGRLDAGARDAGPPDASDGSTG